MSSSARFSFNSLQLALALIITSLPVLLFSFYLYNRSRAAENRLIDLDTQIIARTLQRRVESFTRNRIMGMKLASAFYEGSDDVDDNEFTSFSDHLCSGMREFSVFGYMDAKGKLLQSYPKGIQQDAIQAFQSSAAQLAIHEVVTKGKYRVLSLVPLPKGTRGTLILYPVIKQGKVVGLVLGGISAPNGFDRILGEEVSRYWGYALFNENGDLLYSSLEGKENANAELLTENRRASESITFGDLTWQLVLHPKVELSNALQTFGPEKTLLCGALTTILVILGVALLFWRQRKLQNALDATSRSHAVLQESERRFRDVLERVQLLGVVLDREGRIVFCNDRFLHATGYLREEVIGKDMVAMFVPIENRDNCRERHRDVIEGRACVINNQIDLLTRDGHLRQIAWNHVISYDGNGEVDVVTSLGDDITDRLANEEAQRQSQKLESLGVLAGGIAHDFNNLLTAIIGHNDLAMKKMGAQSPIQMHLENVGRTARRLADLTSQMLAYSGRGRFELKDVDVNTVVREMSDLMRISIPKRVEIYYNLHENLPTVEGDGTQMEQVLLNLVTNAAESLHDRPGKITLRTQQRELRWEEISRLFTGQTIKPGIFVELAVQDNGCGIDPEKLPRIFDPFFSTKFTGRGLGLAVLQGIVRGHGGAVMVESELNKGTTFRVFFPAKKDAETVNEPERVPAEKAAAERKNGHGSSLPKRTGSGTILIVDDEESVRLLASEILKLSGFETLEAPDGETALELYERHRAEIAAILLDVTMPGMGGHAAHGKLREINPDVRIVLTSGYSNVEIARQFQENHLAGFVQKPFLPSELTKCIFEAAEPVSKQRWNMSSPR